MWVRHIPLKNEDGNEDGNEDENISLPCALDFRDATGHQLMRRRLIRRLEHLFGVGAGTNSCLGS